MTRLIDHAARLFDRVARWQTILLWLLLMTALSSIPNAAPPQEPAFPGDKIAHFIEYGVLGGLLTWVFLRRYGDGSRGRIVVCVLAAVALATTWGMIDETYQRLIPGRDASWQDLAADVLGATTGAVVSALIRARTAMAKAPP